MWWFSFFGETKRVRTLHKLKSCSQGSFTDNPRAHANPPLTQERVEDEGGLNKNRVTPPPPVTPAAFHWLRHCSGGAQQTPTGGSESGASVCGGGRSAARRLQSGELTTSSRRLFWAIGSSSPELRVSVLCIYLLAHWRAASALSPPFTHGWSGAGRRAEAPLRSRWREVLERWVQPGPGALNTATANQLERSGDGGALHPGRGLVSPGCRGGKAGSPGAVG